MIRDDNHAFCDYRFRHGPLWGLEVFAYCLMSIPIMFVLGHRKGICSRVMRHVDGLHTQRFNRSHGREGSLFRGVYKGDFDRRR